MLHLHIHCLQGKSEISVLAVTRVTWTDHRVCCLDCQWLYVPVRQLTQGGFVGTGESSVECAAPSEGLLHTELDENIQSEIDTPDSENTAHEHDIQSSNPKHWN